MPPPNQRTTGAAVIALLQGDYNTRRAPDVQPFIDTASPIVDQVVTWAAGAAVTLTAFQLEIIERWLSAHFYVMVDQALASKSTGGASGNFQGQTGMRLEASKYGQAALLADVSGGLDALNKRAVASSAWSGKTKSEQSSYQQRN